MRPAINETLFAHSGMPHTHIHITHITQNNEFSIIKGVLSSHDICILFAACHNNQP